MMGAPQTSQTDILIYVSVNTRQYKQFLNSGLKSPAFSIYIFPPALKRHDSKNQLSALCLEILVLSVAIWPFHWSWLLCQFIQNWGFPRKRGVLCSNPGIPENWLQLLPLLGLFFFFFQKGSCFIVLFFYVLVVPENTVSQKSRSFAWFNCFGLWK